MKIKSIKGDFTISKVSDYSQIDLTANYAFVGKTDEELSLVCETDTVPTNVTERSDGWGMMRIEGTLDFSLVGILSHVSTVLAQRSIGLFAVSTFNTDYVLVKRENYARALEALSMNGYEIVVTEKLIKDE